METSRAIQSFGAPATTASTAAINITNSGSITTRGGNVRIGNAFFGAVRFVGTDNLAVGGQSIGAPAPVVTGGTTAGLASLNQAATATSNAAANALDSASHRSQGPRRIVFLDFLGFGADPN